MARINASEELDKYSTGEGNYFSLPDDGDTARVRFMYTGVQDIEAFAVHKVKMPDDSYRYIDCLRSYADPKDACPLCQAYNKLLTKFFVPLYNIEKDEIQTWERGKNFYSKLAELCSQNTPLVSHEVEIERHGEKGDINTTYEMYADENDGTTLDDLPEVPDPIGTIILSKTFDELTNFVNTGSFDGTGANSVSTNSSNNEDRRRRGSSETGSVSTRRRTTSGNNF